jgi:NADPH:quinone reductase
VDRVVDVALGANLQLDLAVAAPNAVVVTYAAEPTDPTLPTRALMSANLVLRFVLLYNIGDHALQRAVDDVHAALAAGALTKLPTTVYPLDEIVAAHEAVEAGTTGKVLIDLR